MRCLTLIAAAGLLLAAPATAFAADPEDVAGYYLGTAACPGGEAQIILSLDAGSGDAVTGRLKVTPIKGAQVARGEYDIEGTVDGMDWLSVKGPGKVAFAGAWFAAEGDEEPTLLGELKGSGCKDFNLTRQYLDGPV